MIQPLIDKMQEGKSYLVFLIVDHDCFGHRIRDSFQERCETLGLDAEFVHVGIMPQQVEDKDQKSYLMKKGREDIGFERWCLEYAYEINGLKRYGFEIEAADPKIIRRDLAEAILSRCDQAELYEFLLEVPLEEMHEGVASEVWKELFERASEALAAKDHEFKEQRDRFLVLENQIDVYQSQIDAMEEERDSLDDAIRERVSKDIPTEEELAEKSEQALEADPTLDNREIPESLIRDAIIEAKPLNYQPYVNTEQLGQALKEILLQEGV